MRRLHLYHAQPATAFDRRHISRTLGIKGRYSRAELLPADKPLPYCVRGFGFLAELTRMSENWPATLISASKQYGAGCGRGLPIADGSGWPERAICRPL
jgi:hypothetical protein